MSRTLSQIAHNSQFDIQIRQALLTAQRSGRQVGLLIIDFHEAEKALEPADGSADLSEAFTAIADTVRESDTLWRITGTGSAVLLSAVGHPDDAILVATKILDRLDQLLQTTGNQRLQSQIGVALYPHHAHSASSLLECAEIALSTARKNKERWVLYSPQLSGSPRPPLHLRELRQAIVQDQLFAVYQPKIDLRDDRITGVEVLTRWRHPLYGLIMPDEFIPLAERTGLIVPLTLWVLNQAIGQCRRWRDEGINVSLAVNLSMWNLDCPELPEQIAGLLGSAGVPADQLELEITESALMDDPQRAMRTLKAIRELGVHFAIDDFGIGYSSMSHLKKMPVSSIKIDKSFTQNMESDNDSAIIVRAIIDLGHNLGLKVVAEGVETLAAKKMLLEFGCDEAQGYYFSRPVPAAEIRRQLREPRSIAVTSPENPHAHTGWAAEKRGDIPAAVKPVL
jgi:EAL domain-containing protein (putative c-di-GMP-specific phosphodiesterase class I)/GGDEF domain-containing protein